MAQAQYFLKIDGIEGESADDRHRGEIEVESFAWGETQAGGAGHAAGGGAGAAKVQPQDLQIAKRVDKSSPLLMIGCATGQHFKSAILTARKTGGQQQEYLKITIEDVVITSYQTGSSQGSVLPMDQVAVAFARLEMSYREQKPDGSLGSEVKQKFDFVANKKV
jgi:type VI secretion system secreted protein Hcp